VVEDFVSTTDLAPTFLEAAGLPVPGVMTGRSVLGILAGGKSGQVDPARAFVLAGKERHVPGQEAPNMGGTPMRSIRTREFLYIRNYAPDRWPAGTPHYRQAAIPGAWLADCDSGPTKSYLVDHKEDDDAHRRFYNLAFAKRPAEELYDLNQDPDQLTNVAGNPAHAETKARLWKKLQDELAATGDPRHGGPKTDFDGYPYFGGAPKFPGYKAPKK